MSRFFTKKYRKANTIYWGLSALLILFSIFGIYNIPQEKITTFIPLQNLYYEFTTIFITIPITATIGALIGGYLLSPIYLFIHKSINPKMVYFIQEPLDMGTFNQIFNGFYPALLAFNINSMIIQRYPQILESILSSSFNEAPDMMRYLAGSAILMMGSIGIGMIFFSPVFFLNDGCILYSSRNLVKETGRPIETRTVGGWFYGYFKGYAGLSVAFSYFLIVFSYINNFSIGSLFILFWIGLPLFITVSVIPAFIFLDQIKKHRIRYVQRIAWLMGIPHEGSYQAHA